MFPCTQIVNQTAPIKWDTKKMSVLAHPVYLSCCCMSSTVSTFHQLSLTCSYYTSYI